MANKAKKNKNNSYNENIETKKVIIVTISIIIIIIGMYFLSSYIVDKRKKEDEETKVAEVSINYNTVNVGMILNRPYKDYYVLVYDASKAKAMYYSTFITGYQSKESSQKIYFCDLGDELNKKFKSSDEKSNINAKDIEELSFGKLSLLKIKNGKIDKWLENENDIKKELDLQN